MGTQLRRVVMITAVIGAAFGAGAWWSERTRDRVAHATSGAVVYACPMHPQYRSDHPGDCPSCGMKLEPFRGNRTGSDGSAAALPPGAVQVSSERQQATGIRLGLAERVSGTRMLRTTGRVVPTESATYPVVAGVSGWIREVGSATSGNRVRKNEVLASFYAPEFVNAQQSYYAGLETVDRATTQQPQTYQQLRVIEGVQRYADVLRNLGVSETQLAQMSKRRELVQDIYIVSPVDGFVLQRNVSNGLRFDRGFELYRIADLQRVWVLADVYQHQLPFIARGRAARITTAQDNRVLSGTVSHAEPIFDEATLTLKVRLETENPGLVLKPGMFVDVEFPIDLPGALAVPADAIVDSGIRKTVFVERGGGYFEPRQVETGWRLSDQVEIITGLMEGERIVISGTFLIDSESRMKAAAHRGAAATVRDPVCGMQTDQQEAAADGRRVDHDGTTYYFCAKDCQHQFQQDPARYLKSTTLVTEPSTAKDPICGMDVNVKEAKAAGRTSQRGDLTYYFCSDHCKKAFDAGKK